MSVRLILSSAIMLILVAASTAAKEENGFDESNPIRMVSDNLREVENTIVQIPCQSRHVLSFSRFAHRYEKKYQSVVELKLRFSVFKENLNLSRSTNKKSLPYKLSIDLPKKKKTKLEKVTILRNSIPLITMVNHPPEISPPITGGTLANPPSKSYSSIVQNKSSLSKYQLDVSVVNGYQTARIPTDIYEAPLWEDYLIGNFLSTSAPHVAKIHVIVNKIWPLGDKSVKIDVFEVNETTVKFRIQERHIRERVLRRGMWNIADIPMVVSKWSPIATESQPEIKTIPMWIVIKKVPHSMFSRKGLRFIASAVGDPKRLHPDTILCKSFDEAKVFVEADLSKELPKSFRFQFDDGSDAEVEFNYPRLPPRCENCKKWGHLKESCLQSSQEKSTEETNIIELTSDPIEHNPSTQVLNQDEAAPSMEPAEASEVAVGSEIAVAQPELKPLEVKSAPNSTLDTETEKGWTSVSPSRSKRNSPQSRNESDDEIVVSNSRFSILEEAEGEKDSGTTFPEENTDTGKLDNMEEGEIQQEPQGEVKPEDTRPKLPRPSKASHKFISESRAQITKDKVPGTSSKRSHKKKA